jgi:hypothetical protein
VLLGSAAIVALFAASVILVIGALDAPTFPEISNDELRRDGIVISNPGLLAGQRTNRDDAEVVARSVTPKDSVVKYTRLVRLQYASLDCICWAVSVVPPGGRDLFAGPSGNTHRVWGVRVFFVFVDGQTGKAVLGKELASSERAAD